MWRCAKISVRGSAHLQNGLPCQDWTATRLVGADDRIVICAISDGAGSAKFADEASRLAAENAVAYFARLLKDHPNPEELIAEFDQSDVQGLITEIRVELQRIATSRETSIQDFDATLLAYVIHPKRSFFLQVGDGCWCASRDGVLGAITWPSHGEFVGQTYFLTSTRFDEAVQTARISGTPDFVVGITDGLERLGLDLEGGLPHRGFFGPIVQKLISSDDTDAFELSLRQFLDSDRVCERTDDDKSIVIVAKNGCRS